MVKPINTAEDLTKFNYEADSRLKLLSYNVQVGIGSQGYRDYVTQSWRHILPDSRRQANLTEIAHWLSEYDIVALQEVDAGSIRTHYINQVAFLAQKGGFPHWHHQQNRHFGKLAAHSNGLLAKHPVDHIIHHKLPGRIAGRGALQATFGHGDSQLLVLSVHLALSPKARRKQLAYISELVIDYPYFIIMGDMNCRHSQAQAEFAKQGLAVQAGNSCQPTFPRWKPKYHFDQIWVSEGLRIVSCEVMDLGVSDHLPIAIEIEIPEQLQNIKSLPEHYLN
ncbi:endonuclease/exonuclease/phosphatase family protein [Aliikangiella coralliicola]|uniref:EEP domain-containing protein n=1 Tax=Aliikangiella coralliicola TaxID=2592383 RepID=A0A545UI54_9GAMM|nr:endonuclease/exonuclease/phosphatase family protein [Aliikangiella coralliicola]TQV89138.1 EEP domain-containing protein [Aliikangiella coralliicola]